MYHYLPHLVSMVFGAIIGSSLIMGWPENLAIMPLQIGLWLWAVGPFVRWAKKNEQERASSIWKASYGPLDETGAVDLKKNDDPTWL